MWAFGVVLFEMLTGRRLFGEETLSDTLVAVLTREPDWTRLPAATPPSVRRLLRRCLERDPKRRLRAIADARLELNEAFDATETEARAPGTVWRRLPWGVALAALVLSGWLALAGRSPHAPLDEPTHAEIALPADVEPAVIVSSGTIALSPDGALRRSERLEGRGSPDPAVAFSPDGRELAFMDANGSLRRLALADGQRRVVTTDATASGDLSWTPAGIVYGGNGGLWIVSPEGGPARRLTELDAERGELLHDSPLHFPAGAGCCS